MEAGFRIACLVLMLLAAATPSWAVEPIGPASKDVLEMLRNDEGGEPTAVDLVGALNRATKGMLENGKYASANTVAREALALGERDLGQEHRETLTALNNLAGGYANQGRYDEAESLYVRVLETRERVLGKDHPDILQSVNNLGVMYQTQGRYSKAEPLLVRALETRERVLGKDHPDTLRSLNNLAVLYQAQSRYSEAKPLYVRSLETHERVLGKDHSDTLGSINNLAMLYQAQGRYDEAEPLLVHALEAHEQVLGKDHPDTIISVTNLGTLYLAQNRYSEATPLFVRALKGTQGRGYPTLFRVAELIDRGHQDEALRELRRIDEHRRRLIGVQLTKTRSNHIRRRWLLSESGFLDIVFNLALEYPRPDALRLAADMLSRSKRLTEGPEALIARFVRTSDDPKVKETAEKLARYRADLSRLINSQTPNDKNKAATHANAIIVAIEHVERLEMLLAKLSGGFRDYRAGRAIDWKQVRSGLPENSALLSLHTFRLINSATSDFRERHWLALVIPAKPGTGPEILLKDLGPITPTEATRKELRTTGSKAAARKLYQLLFGELDAELTKYDRLYIAPDGALDLIPFARLILPDGHYWVERQELHRIQTGRDLVKRDSDTTSAAGMVVYGGVDYAACPEPKPLSAAKQLRGPTVASGVVDDGQILAVSQRLRNERRCFCPLELTGHEAKAISQFYWDSDNSKPEIWQSQDASETRLKSLLKPSAFPPRILHLATHGFFLGQDKPSERPLTLAGLALAGANDGLYGKTSPTGEDGILYALETQDLNLKGTELVALSACDTGRGEVDYSEGVYGLVRAFRIAGARNVLMSLWKLKDPRAAVFMKDFYAKWFEDPERHPAEVLREIQLAWIRAKDSKRSNPKYWAPYVLIESR